MGYDNFIQEEHYLAFVDYAGKSVDGRYIYRFDFTQAPDIVWGDQWNATPAGIIPTLEPDTNCLSISGQVLSKTRYLLAKENTCFSMQDCIDGILPLLFNEPYAPDLMVLPFGISMQEVIDILHEHDLEIINLKDLKEDKDNEVIEGLIDKMKTNEEPPEEDF